MTDITFTGLALRASRYPIIMRRGQMPRIKDGKRRGPCGKSDTLAWLLLNAQEINKVLEYASPRKT